MGLKERLSAGESVFGVVGLGYVGLPLAVEMAKAGNRVVGFDVFDEKVQAINAGESYVPDVPADELRTLVEQGLFSATTDFARVRECDAVVICVPTPLDEMKDPDVSFIVNATESIAPHLHPDVLVTLESTTYPGTTEEVVLPILEAAGLTVGKDLFVAFSPERVDPGNPVYQTKNTPKVVGGVTPECTEIAVAFYGRFLDHIVPVSSTRAAEMSKLLENIFRCVNIALVDELLMLSALIDVDIWEVIDAAKTKPFGFMPFYPGPGLGGHCIPIDPFYLSWKAREYNFHTEFIELAGKVTDNMPDYVIRRLMEALNTQGKALSTSRVLMLGVAYKPGIGDMRESPAIKITELLLERGAAVVYHDPFVPTFEVAGTPIEAREITEAELRQADVALIVTDHRTVDYGLVVEHAPLVFDTRNATRAFPGDNVVRL